MCIRHLLALFNHVKGWLLDEVLNLGKFHCSKELVDVC